ncbi:hypothetical protein EV421DRAFT_1716343, partial [Armillaria borealis]
YRLAGVMYYSMHHFTAQYVDHHERIWFNDGIVLGRQAVPEGLLCDVDMSKDKSGKGKNIFIYRRADVMYIYTRKLNFFQKKLKYIGLGPAAWMRWPSLH